MFLHHFYYLFSRWHWSSHRSKKVLNRLRNLIQEFSASRLDCRIAGSSPPQFSLEELFA
jgi:hypothetical protein